MTTTPINLLPLELEAALDVAFGKFVRAFPASLPTVAAQMSKKHLFREMLRDHEWITPKVLSESATHVAWHWQGPKNDGVGADYLPPMATFVQACRDIARAEREKEHSAQVFAALPAPLSVDDGHTQLAPEKWDRNIAIGKARQRKRIAFINAYRATLPPGVWKYGGEQSQHWRGRDTPTEDEIDDVLREMHAAGKLKGSLEKALAVRVPINILPDTSAPVYRD
jgi:hypothetical protein